MPSSPLIPKDTSGGNYRVNDAGIVLFSNFISTLFHRLDLVDHTKFKNTQTQQKALTILLYLSKEQNNYQEWQSPLAKVLCGIPIQERIDSEITISETDIELIHELITAVINLWSAIRLTTITALRESFIVREGMLIEHEDRWELTVESRPYDILLQTVPFSFSTVKLSWMDKLLHVNWRL